MGQSVNHLSTARLGHLAAAAIMLLGMLVALWSLASPAVVPADGAADQFSAERASEHVAVIAAEPHPIGSAAIGRVREYLGAELAALGIDVELQTTTMRDFYGSGGPVSIVNVIGRIPGAASTGAVLLIAHYDTVPETPGANDNSAAVATLLETARVLIEGPAVNNDVILLFTDAEEPAGRAGASAFLPSAAERDVRFVVNFEALGESGPALLAELSGGGWVLAELDDAVSHPGAFSFLTGLAEIFGEVGTDFDPFRDAGYPGLHFVYLHGSPIYHTAADSVERVGAASLQHHGSHAVGVALHYGDLDLREDRDSGQVVFSMVGPILVRHPAAATVGLSALALVLAAWQMRRERILASGRGLVAGILALTAGTAVWLVLAGINSAIGVAESYIYLGALLAGTILLAHWLTGSAHRGDAGPGVVAVWIVFAVTTSLFAPGLSMMLAWPALAAAGAWLWRASTPAAAAARFGIVVFPAIVLVLPAIDVFWQMAQPRPGNLDSELLWAATLPLLLGLMLFGLIVSFWPREHRSG
jgi:hypothetical protein